MDDTTREIGIILREEAQTFAEKSMKEGNQVIGYGYRFFKDSDKTFGFFGTPTIIYK